MSIIGNSVGSALPKTDYTQTDSTAADYLEGRTNLNNLINTKLSLGGGTLQGNLLTKGIILTSGVDYGTQLPSTSTVGKLFFLKLG